MTKHVKNLIGKPFGRLKVLSFNGVRGKSKHSYWNCICLCGKKVIMRGAHLRSRLVRSCGCWGREQASVRLKKYARSSRHRGAGNPMWNGKDPEYSTIHQWLTRHYSKKQCQKCGTKNKRFDWALKRGRKHGRSRKLYLCLCRPCHRRYDKRKL